MMKEFVFAMIRFFTEMIVLRNSIRYVLSEPPSIDSSSFYLVCFLFSFA